VLVLTLGEVLVAPAHQAAAAEIGDPARMGRAFGLLGMTQTLGFAVAPLAGGILFDALHHRPLVMWGAVAASALVMAAAYRRLTRYLPVR
jgi:MFS family permease